MRIGNKDRYDIYVLFLLFFTVNIVKSQQTNLDFLFGTNITKPYVNTQTNINSKWAHNFWLGLDLKLKMKGNSHLHLGGQVHGENFRFSSIDSPTTTFITATSINLPVQIGLNLRKSHFALLMGLTPKYMISGHIFTSDPVVKDPIYFQKSNYTLINLGVNCGMVYGTSNFQYFIYINSDLSPFYTYKSTRYFNNKITFGFTTFNIFRSTK